MKILIDITGWLGSLVILISYALSLSKTRDYSISNRYLNLLGGLMIAFNCYYYNAIPSFVSNLLWSLIAVCSMHRAKRSMLNKRNNTFKDPV